jgi:hypothetical protein
MESTAPPEFEDWLDLLDFDAIADPFDKIAECQYFLDLASKEPDVQRFRWLISAFFGAAYSFFEINALSAFHAFADPQTGKLIEDAEALEILRRYVTIFQNVKSPSFVKTGGLHEVTKQLYELRKGNTHHFPLSIMSTGLELPEAFHLGKVSGQGIPALAFCRKAMALMHQVNQELQA